MSVQGLKLGYRPEDVIECYGSAEVYHRAVSSGLLKPRIQQKKLTLFNAADVIKCWEKIMASGELPPPRPRKTPRATAAQSAKGADHVE